MSAWRLSACVACSFVAVVSKCDVNVSSEPQLIVGAGWVSLETAGAVRTVEGLTFGGGGYLARVARGVETAAVLNVEHGRREGRLIRVGLVGDADDVLPPILVMRFDSASGVTAQDFVPFADVEGKVPTNFTVRVAEGDGCRNVWLDWTIAGNSARRVYADNPATWCDAKAIRPEADYIVDGLELRETAGTPARVYAFPGHSLTLRGTNASRGRYVSKHDEMSCCLTMESYSGFGFGGGTTGTQTLGGTLHVVCGRGGYGIVAAGADGRVCGCECSLTGTGWLRFLGETAGAGSLTYVLSGANGEFAGSLELGGIWQNDAWQADAGEVCYRVNSAENLGGGLPSFRPDAVALRPGARLVVQGDATFDAPNRGWTLEGPCTIEVPAGVSCVVQERVAWKGGTFRKTGGGTLVLSQLDRDGGEDRTLQVQEGSLRCFSGASPAEVQIEIAAGADWKPLDSGLKLLLQ